MVKLVLKGDVPSKKNGKRIVRNHGKTMLISSERFQRWEREAMMEAKYTWKIKEPIVPQEQVILTFYPSNNRRCDLTNKAESIMDLLVDTGVLTDDNWHLVKSLRLEMGGVDKVNPRVEIVIV